MLRMDNLYQPYPPKGKSMAAYDVLRKPQTPTVKHLTEHDRVSRPDYWAIYLDTTLVATISITGGWLTKLTTFVPYSKYQDPESWHQDPDRAILSWTRSHYEALAPYLRGGGQEHARLGDLVGPIAGTCADAQVTVPYGYHVRPHKLVEPGDVRAIDLISGRPWIVEARHQGCSVSIRHPLFGTYQSMTVPDNEAAIEARLLREISILTEVRHA